MKKCATILLDARHIFRSLYHLYEPRAEDLKLIKNAPHHPGRQEPPAIFRSKQVIASHVLEIKTSSGFCQNLKKDQTLRLSRAIIVRKNDDIFTFCNIA